MPMSKKHYTAIANAINATLWEDKSDPATTTLLAARLASVFEQDNARFDRGRFLSACTADRDTVSQMNRRSE